VEKVFQDQSRGFTRAAEPAFQRTGHDNAPGATTRRSRQRTGHDNAPGTTRSLSPMPHNLHRGCYLTYRKPGRPYLNEHVRSLPDFETESLDEYTDGLLVSRQTRRNET
jgi:hypothetical protein